MKLCPAEYVDDRLSSAIVEGCAMEKKFVVVVLDVCSPAVKEMESDDRIVVIVSLVSTAVFEGIGDDVESDKLAFRLCDLEEDFDLELLPDL